MNRSHMKLIHLIAIVSLLGSLQAQTPAAAQRPNPGGGGMKTSISGSVVDSGTRTPVEYANVMVHLASSGAAVTGTITNEHGRFQISPVRPDQYYVTVKFMGFAELRIDSLFITMATPRVHLGELQISPAAVEGEAVEVVRERTTMEYRIDKKVINVGQDISSSTGTAVDVLENVPSVTTDIEGNVELRSSSNFTVLIDNRPSILDANEALQTIPASTIDQIEIITNPSAAYDPDGVSGIINILTKKSKLEGISGIANVNAGMLGQLGGDVLVSYRNDRYTIFFSAATGNRNFEGRDSTFSMTTIGDTNTYVSSIGDRYFRRNYSRLRAGLDYNLSDADLLGLKLSYGSRAFSMGGENSYNEYGDLFLVPLESTTESSSDRGGQFYNVQLDYEHRFDSPKHRLTARYDYSIRATDEESLTEQFSINDSLISGTLTDESGPINRSRFELNYERPILNEGELKAGYHFRAGSSEDESGLATYDNALSEYVDDPFYDHQTEYHRGIQSIFTTASSNFGKFGIQGGFRGEYTYRSIEVLDEDDSFEIDRWDFFPTLHLSYNLTEQQKLMASYSRRVRRPRGWFLEPFETWMDAYNVRIGNPGLEPVYINAMEAGYMRYFGKNMVSLELFSKEVVNQIERVQSVYDENVLLHTFENVGSSRSLGADLSLRMLPFEWWDLNLMGNVYRYEINDESGSFDQDIQSNNWSLRFNNNFTLNKMIRLQLNAMYNSPSVTAQGERESMFYLNAGARLTLIENKLTATVNVRDVLDTGNHEFTTEGLNFTRYQISDRVAPVISASLKYNFNNYRSRDKSRGMNGINGGENDEGDDF